jgi:hypothetical protein
MPLQERSPAVIQTGGAPATFNGGDGGASDWQRIAEMGNKLQTEAGQAIGLDVHKAQVGYLADQDVEIASKKTEMRDQYAGNPDAFKAAWNGYTEGKIGQAETWALPHIKKMLGSEGNSAYGSILGEKRATDHRLENESIDARLKMADSGVQELAASGQLGTPEGKAAVQLYNGVLDSAVSVNVFPPEKADLLREDMALRAHGGVIRSGLEDVYRRDGFESARDWLKGAVKDLGAQYKFSDKLEKAGLAWLRSEESGLRGERDAISREWAGAKGQASTLAPEVLADMQRRAYAAGAIKVADDIGTQASALQVNKLIRGLPESDRMNIARTGNIGATLSGRESGNDPKVVNQLGFAGLYQFGAPRLADLGVYIPGPQENLGGWNKTSKDAPGKWSGTFNIPGFPEVKTLPDFLASPDAQKAAFEIHRGKMDQEIQSLGLDKYVGQTVGGVPITQDGLRSMIHLAGAGGAQAFLASGGQDNRADANGTRVSEYAKLGAAGDLTQSRSGLVALGMLKKDLAHELAGKIDRLGTAIGKTEFPPLDEIVALGSQADLLGNEEQRRKVAELGATAEYGARFSQFPPAKRAEVISAWDARLKGSGTEYERGLRDTLRTADTKISEQYRTDPYGAAYRFSTGFDALPAIDFASKDAPGILTAKVQQQNAIRADQGMGSFSALRPDEAANLSVALTKGDTKQAGAALDMLTALPPDIYKATIADPSVKNALDGMVRSYDPMRLNLAMSTLDRQWHDDPVGFTHTFGDETVRRLQTWQALKDSLPADQMAERFKRADDPATRDARKKLETDAEEKLKSIKPADVAVAMGSSFGVTPAFVSQSVTGSDPIAPADPLQAARLVAEYDKVFRERYVDTADADKSKAQAVERLKTVWGPSAINGGTLMRHPPERYYPQVDGKADWMTKDLEAGIANYTGTPRYTMTEDSSQTGAPPTSRPNWSYKLMSDQQTEAEVASRQPPSYVVTVTDAKTGRDNIPIGTDGKPMRYRFDPTQAQNESRAKFDEQHAAWFAAKGGLDNYWTSPGIGGP